MIALFARGQRVAYVDPEGVPHHAQVVDVHRVSCTVRLRSGDELTVPMSSLHTCPITLARCGATTDRSLPEDAA